MPVELEIEWAQMDAVGNECEKGNEGSKMQEMMNNSPHHSYDSNYRLMLLC